MAWAKQSHLSVSELVVVAQIVLPLAWVETLLRLGNTPVRLKTHFQHFLHLESVHRLLQAPQAGLHPGPPHTVIAVAVHSSSAGGHGFAEQRTGEFPPRTTSRPADLAQFLSATPACLTEMVTVSPLCKGSKSEATLL